MKILVLSIFLLCAQYSGCNSVKEKEPKHENKTVDPLSSTNSLLKF